MQDIIIIKAIDYIKEHLDEDLTVEVIAEHCHFSKYYFNRLFKSIIGESVYAFIKRLRIETSAFQITREYDKSITQISSSYGYSSSNYSTAFKKHYGKSPAVFKKNRYKDKIISNDLTYCADLTDKDYDYYNSRMKLVELTDVEVVYQRFIGNYVNLKNYWREFLDKHRIYYNDESIQFEISYDDPILTNPNRCITDVCITTSKPIKDGCNTMILTGGKYMMYEYEGSNKKIFETFQGLLGIWSINTHYKMDFKSRKIITKYNTINHNCNYFSFDIYIPII
ncbi:AraC family transcriptional regulator [Clostridiaceae bacterium M8S5]|nr:AraC family transcriptional regulator [Clostridiaceae bacterium M8S5]